MIAGLFLCNGEPTLLTCMSMKTLVGTFAVGSEMASQRETHMRFTHMGPLHSVRFFYYWLVAVQWVIFSVVILPTSWLQ